MRGRRTREKPPPTGEVAAKQAGGAFAVRGGGRPRRGQDPSLRCKRQKGGTGKVEGRACPAGSRLRASLRRGRRPRRPAVQAVVCGQCVGEECIPPGVFAAAQGSRAACMPPLRANPLTSAYPAERSRPLRGSVPLTPARGTPPGRACPAPTDFCFRHRGFGGTPEF